MPIKGDVKKDFLKMSGLVKNSATLSTKFLTEQILNTARRDGIITGENMERWYSRKKGKKYMRYKEITAADMLSKFGRKLFHHSKFVSRAGNLAKNLTPARWSGNRLSTLGTSSVEVESSGNKAILTFDGRTEIILKGGKNARVKNKIDLIDKEGKVIGEAGVRRRIIENAARSVNGLWNTFLKKELDKAARAFK